MKASTPFLPAFFLAIVTIMPGGCANDQPPLAGGKPASYWVESLKSPDPELRRKAAFKLGNVGPADATVVPALMEALHDDDPDVRAEAVLALAKCGSEAKVAATRLTDMRDNDPDARVREYAGKALERLRRLDE